MKAEKKGNKIQPKLYIKIIYIVRLKLKRVLLVSLYFIKLHKFLTISWLLNNYKPPPKILLFFSKISMLWNRLFRSIFLKDFLAKGTSSKSTKHFGKTFQEIKMDQILTTQLEDQLLSWGKYPQHVVTGNPKSETAQFSFLVPVLSSNWPPTLDSSFSSFCLRLLLCKCNLKINITF